MNIKQRIIINTVSIYIGIAFSVLVSLITVPILLNILGVNDYGLFNLIAGIIAMLSFMKSSMIVTVQRYMNVAMGANNMLKVNKVYSISTLLYLLIAILTAIIIESIIPVLINDFLTIELRRIHVAYLLFHILVVSMFFTTISIPLDALFNVHEEMWFFSIFNFVEALLKLLLAFFLMYIPFQDKLLVYSIGIGVLSILIYVIKYILCTKRYKHIQFVSIVRQDRIILSEILSFIGWNLYSTLARLFSTQGFALVLNHFIGTIANASYGIANQINGALTQFTNSIEKAFNPQIMKNEGAQQRERVISLALQSTKFCSLIYSMLAIPLLFSLSFLLKLWLKEIPDYTIGFSSLIIIASMIAMLSVGITSIFYAMGKVKFYLITMGTILIINVIVAYALLSLSFDVYIVFSLFILLEILLLFIRIIYAQIIVGLKIEKYFRFIIFPYLKVVVPVIFISYFIQPNSIVGLLLHIIVSILLYLIIMYKFCLTNSEKNIIDSFLLRIKKMVL